MHSNAVHQPRRVLLRMNGGLKFYVRSSLQVVRSQLIRPYPDECHQLFVQIEAYATFTKTHIKIIKRYFSNMLFVKQ
jgi:hypothetical protein